MSQRTRKRQSGGKRPAKESAASSFGAPLTEVKDRNVRAEATTGIAASLFAALIYVPTTAPAITLLDAADFALGAQTLGIVHPPGFPLYTVFGFIFSKLPLGLDPAHQMHLFSAIAAVGAIGILAAALRLAVGKSVPAFFGAAAFAVTGAMWSQAVIAECYAMHAFFLALMLYFLLAFRRSASNSALSGLAVATGLALANHYPLTMLTACGLLPLVPFRRMSPRSVGWSTAVVILCAVVPYSYLFIQSARIDKLAYAFGPMIDARLVIEWILRTKYSSVDQAGGGLADKANIFLFLTGAAFRDYMVFALIGAWGVISLWSRDRLLAISSIAASFGGLLILCLMLGFRAVPPWYDVAYAYTHSFFLILALPVAEGAQRLITVKKIPSAGATVAMVMALMLQVWSVFPRVSQHDNYAVRDWARTLLNSLAKDAVLIAPGDDVMPLYYTQFKEGVRPDVVIMDRYGLVTKQKLFTYDPHHDVDVKARYLAETALIRSRDRAVYYTGQVPGLEQMGGKTVNLGLVYRVNTPEEKFLLRPDGQPEGIDPHAFGSLISLFSDSHPRKEMFMDGFRRQNFMRLAAFARSKGALTLEEVSQALSRYALNENIQFMADLANEFIIAGLAHDALTIFDRIKNDVAQLPAGNIRSYCQLLINGDRRDEAREICRLQMEKAEPCDPDPRYNLGVAYWSDRAKAIEYLRSALACKSDFQPAKDLLNSLGEKH